MSIFLTLAYLFFIGSVFGWILELVYRNRKHRSGKWVNPGFCTGPYLPIYGFGLITLFLLASLEKHSGIQNPIMNKLVLFLAMAVGMTAIEYLAGFFSLKYLKVQLWDYSGEWGNIQGIICPLFSLYWALLGGAYYFLIHPYILEGLEWLSRNLAFSFFIGMFFGVFLIDVVHSANLVIKLKKYAQEHSVIVRYEAIKRHIAASHGKNRSRYRFFRPFRSLQPLSEVLKEMYETVEEKSQNLKKRTHR